MNNYLDKTNNFHTCAIIHACITTKPNGGGVPASCCFEVHAAQVVPCNTFVNVRERDSMKGLAKKLLN